MRKLKNRKGAAAVEFALVLPLLVIVVFGIIEFSLVLYDKAVITNASREGARAGIVSQSPRINDSEIIAVVDNYCAAHLISFKPGAVPGTTIERAGTGFGDELTVNVSYAYDFLVLPKFVTTLTGSLNLIATTVMRME